MENKAEGRLEKSEAKQEKRREEKREEKRREEKRREEKRREEKRREEKRREEKRREANYVVQEANYVVHLHVCISTMCSDKPIPVHFPSFSRWSPAIGTIGVHAPVIRSGIWRRIWQSIGLFEIQMTLRNSSATVVLLMMTVMTML